MVKHITEKIHMISSFQRTRYYQSNKHTKEWIYEKPQNWFEKRVSIIFDQKNPWLSLHGRVLDAGCGDGGLIRALQKRFPQAQYDGTDISAKACQKTSRVAKNTFTADLNEPLSVKDATYDAIVSQETIEHLVDTDTFLSEMHRVLKQKGILVLTTPNLLAWHQRLLCLFGIAPTFSEVSMRNKSIGLGILKSIFKQTEPAGHIRVFTSRALKDMLELYGFEVLSLQGTAVEYPFPTPIRKLFLFCEWIFSRYTSLASNLIVVAQKRIPQK